MKVQYLYPQRTVHHRSGISSAMKKLLLISVGATMIAITGIAIIFGNGF